MILRSRVVPLLAGVTAALALAAGTAVAVPASPGPEGKARSSAPAARAALSDARAALSGDTKVDVTMALLELWRQRGDLAGADRAAADQLLARPEPEGQKTMCTAAHCYHWTTTGRHRVSATDSDGDGVPDYVETVAETVDGLRSSYVAAGYRPPKPDGTAGGDARMDIYLEDTGAEGYYGYCTTDAPEPSDSGPWDAWGYCVLDNDYAPSQFPTNTPLENLQVTAAHEYFHAIQYAYDAYEDKWLLEATAAWVEDELFPNVNDNIQYLDESPLTSPGRPLDVFDRQTGAHYGTWIFFRFLTEALTDAEGGIPVLVREIWERADGAAGGPDDYSMKAVERVLADRGVSLTTAFASFASANRLPQLAYEEGAALGYPSARPAGTYKLTSSRKDSGWKVATLKHLSAATARFVPGSGLTKGKLKIAVDLPGSTTAATALVVLKSGRVQVVPMPANGKKKVTFGTSKVRYVEVTLANAGSRYRCWTNGGWSCNGTALDDGRKLRVRATAVR